MKYLVTLMVETDATREQVVGTGKPRRFVWTDAGGPDDNVTVVEVSQLKKQN